MMDPNETLDLARKAADTLAGNISPEAALAAAVDLMMYFDSLDNWLTHGGFLPDDWATVNRSAVPRRNNLNNHYESANAEPGTFGDKNA